MSFISLIDDYSSSDDDEQPQLVQEPAIDQPLPIPAETVVDYEHLEVYDPIMYPLTAHLGHPFKWIKFKSAGIMPPKLLESSLNEDAKLKREQIQGDLDATTNDNNNNNNSTQMTDGSPTTPTRHNQEPTTIAPQSLTETTTTIPTIIPTLAQQLPERKWAPSTWDADSNESNESSSSSSSSHVDFNNPLVKVALFSGTKSPKDNLDNSNDHLNKKEKRDRNFGAFGRDGFASRMFDRWGVTGGLGKNEDGILNPVQATLRGGSEKGCPGLGSVESDTNQKELLANLTQAAIDLAVNGLNEDERRQFEEIIQRPGVDVKKISERFYQLRTNQDAVLDHVKQKLTKKKVQQDKFKTDGAMITDFRSGKAKEYSGSASLIGLDAVLNGFDESTLSDSDRLRRQLQREREQAELDALTQIESERQRAQHELEAKIERRAETKRQRTRIIVGIFGDLQNDFNLMNQCLAQDIEKYTTLLSLVKLTLNNLKKINKQNNSHHQHNKNTSNRNNNQPLFLGMDDSLDDVQIIDPSSSTTTPHTQPPSNNRPPPLNPLLALPLPPPPPTHLQFTSPETLQILKKLRFCISFVLVCFHLVKLKACKTYIARMVLLSRELNLRPKRCHMRFFHQNRVTSVSGVTLKRKHDRIDNKKERKKAALSSSTKIPTSAININLPCQNQSLLQPKPGSLDAKMVYGDDEDDGYNVGWGGGMDSSEEDSDLVTTATRPRTSNCSINNYNTNNNNRTVSLCDNNDDDSVSSDEFTTNSTFFDQQMNKNTMGSNVAPCASNKASVTRLADLTIIERTLYELNPITFLGPVVKDCIEAIHGLFSIQTAHSPITIDLLAKTRQLTPATIVNSSNNTTATPDDVPHIDQILSPSANNSNSPMQFNKLFYPPSATNIPTSISFPATSPYGNNNATKTKQGDNANNQPLGARRFTKQSILLSQLQIPFQLMWNLSFDELILLIGQALVQVIDLESVVMPMLTKDPKEEAFFEQKLILPTGGRAYAPDSNQGFQSNQPPLTRGKGYFRPVSVPMSLITTIQSQQENVILTNQHSASSSPPSTMADFPPTQQQPPPPSSKIMPHWFMVALSSELTDLKMLCFPHMFQSNPANNGMINPSNHDFIHSNTLLLDFYNGVRSTSISPPQSTSSSSSPSLTRCVSIDQRGYSPVLLNFKPILGAIFNPFPHPEINHASNHHQEQKETKTVGYDDQEHSLESYYGFDFDISTKIKRRYFHRCFIPSSSFALTSPTSHQSKQLVLFEYQYPYRELLTLLEQQRLKSSSWDRIQRKKSNRMGHKNLKSILIDIDESSDDSSTDDEDDGDDGDDDNENDNGIMKLNQTNPNYQNNNRTPIYWFPLRSFHDMMTESYFIPLESVYKSSYFDLVTQGGESSSLLAQFSSLLTLHQSTILITPMELFITVKKSSIGNKNKSKNGNHNHSTTTSVESYDISSQRSFNFYKIVVESLTRSVKLMYGDIVHALKNEAFHKSTKNGSDVVTLDDADTSLSPITTNPTVHNATVQSTSLDQTSLPPNAAPIKYSFGSKRAPPAVKTAIDRTPTSAPMVTPSNCVPQTVLETPEVKPSIKHETSPPPQSSLASLITAFVALTVEAYTIGQVFSEPIELILPYLHYNRRFNTMNAGGGDNKNINPSTPADKNDTTHIKQEQSFDLTVDGQITSITTIDMTDDVYDIDGRQQNAENKNNYDEPTKDSAQEQIPASLLHRYTQSTPKLEYFPITVPSPQTISKTIIDCRVVQFSVARYAAITAFSTQTGLNDDRLKQTATNALKANPFYRAWGQFLIKTQRIVISNYLDLMKAAVHNHWRDKQNKSNNTIPLWFIQLQFYLEPFLPNALDPGNSIPAIDGQQQTNSTMVRPTTTAAMMIKGSIGPPSSNYFESTKSKQPTATATVSASSTLVSANYLTHIPSLFFVLNYFKATVPLAIAETMIKSLHTTLSSKTKKKKVSNQHGTNDIQITAHHSNVKSEPKPKLVADLTADDPLDLPEVIQKLNNAFVQNINVLKQFDIFGAKKNTPPQHTVPHFLSKLYQFHDRYLSQSGTPSLFKTALTTLIGSYHLIPYMKSTMKALVRSKTENYLPTALSQILSWSRFIPLPLLHKEIISPFILYPHFLNLAQLHSQVFNELNSIDGNDHSADGQIEQTDSTIANQLRRLQTALIPLKFKMVIQQQNFIETYRSLIPFVSYAPIQQAFVAFNHTTLLLSKLISQSSSQFTAIINKSQDQIGLPADTIMKMVRLLKAEYEKLLQPIFDKPKKHNSSKSKMWADHKISVHNIYHFIPLRSTLPVPRSLQERAQQQSGIVNANQNANSAHVLTKPAPPPIIEPKITPPVQPKVKIGGGLMSNKKK